MNKSHTKCFETISKVDNQSSNISDEDIDNGDQDMRKENYPFSSLCRRYLGGNYRWNIFKFHTLYTSSVLYA